jgi:hypothetical protein
MRAAWPPALPARLPQGTLALSRLGGRLRRIPELVGFEPPQQDVWLRALQLMQGRLEGLAIFRPKRCRPVSSNDDPIAACSCHVNGAPAS